MEEGGHRYAPAALLRERTSLPVEQEAGWAPGPVWTGTENLAPQWNSISGPSSSQLVCLLKIRSNILPSTLKSSKWSLFLRFLQYVPVLSSLRDWTKPNSSFSHMARLIYRWRGPGLESMDNVWEEGSGSLYEDMLQSFRLRYKLSWRVFMEFSFKVDQRDT